MNALELNGLCKSFRGFSLGDITFSLPCGSVLGVVGENGAGKSTMIKTILGIIKKDAGSVKIFGQEPKGDAWKNDVGVVLDEPGFSNCLRAADVNKIMKNVFSAWNEKAFAEYTDRLKVPADKRFGELSKGMKMKLSVAAALSHEAKLLIFDEAESGLDPVAREEINEILFEFTRDETRAVLSSSHIVSDLEKVCDYIAFLHQGRLILFEEKDRIHENYVVAHCSETELARLERGAVIGLRRNAYDVEAALRRSDLPAGIPAEPADVESLFVFMAKEEK